jgi:hypothetical protein
MVAFSMDNNTDLASRRQLALVIDVGDATMIWGENDEAVCCRTFYNIIVLL